jgi:hypothetical protein
MNLKAWLSPKRSHLRNDPWRELVSNPAPSTSLAIPHLWIVGYGAK